MNGKLRSMTSLYITDADRMLLLYRQGSRVVNNVWIGAADETTVTFITMPES